MNEIIKGYDPHNSVFIIDGHSMIYRAYFALIRNPLINSKGFNTSAIYGSMRMLFKLLKEFNPEYIVVSFDTGKPNFRHKLFKEYKATRKKMPDDLIPQIGKLKKLLAYFGVPQIEVEGFEADDVIAQLADYCVKKGKSVYTISKDKDLLQIIGDRSIVLQPESGQKSENFTFMDKQKVEDKYGIKPENIPDFLSLTGDTSDNIPGVKGIGPKTAEKLIREYQTIDNLYKNIEKITDRKLKEKLILYKEDAYLSKKLIKLDQKVPMELELDQMLLQKPEKENVLKMFEEMEIKTLLKELNWVEEKTKTADYLVIDTEDALKKLIADELIKSKVFSLDTETDSQFPIKAKLVGISLSTKPNTGYYIPLGHANFFNSKQISIDILKKYLKPVLESDKYSVIGQNIKYDYIVLNNYDITINNIIFDTMVGSYLINPTKTRHNLNELAQYFLGHSMISYKTVVGKNNNFSEVEIKDAMEYSCEDADITLRLYEILNKKIEEQQLKDLFYKVDIPLIKLLAKMEINGIKIDVLKLKKLDKIISKKLESLTARIHEEAGEVFNINSTKQLAVILFEKLKLPAEKKGKTGLSTDIEVLKNLIKYHPIANYLIDYRTLNKLKTTYIDTLPKMINPATKRIHTSFNQTTTATGRLSSSDPNLQNIPIKDEIGKQIREAFIAEDQNLILSADYSQIELRILAHIAEDELLIDAFQKDQDIHTRTIMELYNVAEDDVTPELRRTAKVINYGIIYGMSAYGLSKELNIDVGKATNFINDYFSKYTGINNYIETIKEKIRTDGYIENLFGRRRYLPDMSRFSKQQQSFVLRTAVNTPIQGTAADLIKLAMIEIDKIFIEKKIRSKLLLQVHDELLFEVIPDEKDVVYDIIKKKMENVYDFKVPIKVDIKFGKNWGEAH
ncbi:MAG: DNA polymerase I [Spirochaetes bacterium]|nr:DNA polymerase I [Spirochaetota bacterium]